jgi:hypothetical protein
MLGVSHHYLGDQASARRYLEGVLDRYVGSENRSHIVRFQVDLRVWARTFLAPSLATCGAIKERKTAFPAPNKKLSALPKTTA